MTTRADIRSEVANRMGDSSNAIWTTSELNGYIDKAIKSLYPTYFKLNSDTTTATAGPLQTGPSGVRDIYAIGIIGAGSERVRSVRRWYESQGGAVVPQTGITGDTLVWSWTSGFTSPTDDVTALDCGSECEEVVVLRVCISAIERLLQDRVSAEEYFTLTVREKTTEQDLVQTLDALHASLDQRLKQAIPRPAQKR